MKLMRCVVLLLAVVTLCITGCKKDAGSSGKDRAGDGKLNVFVSLAPQGYFVERIVGDQADVNVLLPSGQSPHTYEITAKQMTRLGDADVFFKIGVPFEDVMIPKLRKSLPDLKIVDCCAGIDLVTMDGHVVKAAKNTCTHGGHAHDHSKCTHGHGDPEGHEKQDEHAHDHSNCNHEHGTADSPSAKDKHKREADTHEHDSHDGHDHGDHEGHNQDAHAGHDHGSHEGHDHAEKASKSGVIDHGDHVHHPDDIDPHTWMSPSLAKRQAMVMFDTLCELDPDNMDVYAKNYDALEKELDSLRAEIAESLKPFKGESFYVYHPAFGYFARDFGLVQVPVEVGGKEPSLRHLNELIEKARKDKVHLIFVQPQFSSRSAETLAEQIGGAVVLLDPLSGDYMENMRMIADSVEKALKKEGDR